jgi:hypothetical protein
MKTKNIVINSVDDYIQETKMLPDLNRNLVFNLNPMEEYFMGVAEKHGMFDNMDDGYDDGYEDEY